MPCYSLEENYLALFLALTADIQLNADGAFKSLGSGQIIRGRRVQRLNQHDRADMRALVRRLPAEKVAGLYGITLDRLEQLL